FAAAAAGQPRGRGRRPPRGFRIGHIHPAIHLDPGRSPHDALPFLFVTDYSDDLRLAHVMADTADDLTMRRFKAADLRVETKPGLTPVSDADRDVEEAIRGTLSRARPRDAIVGEEFGTTGYGSRSWIIDPIDGTKNYVRGVP